MKPQTWLYIPLFSAMAMLTTPAARAAEDNFADIKTEIAAQHDEGVQRLETGVRALLGVQFKPSRRCRQNGRLLQLITIRFVKWRQICYGI